MFSWSFYCLHNIDILHWSVIEDDWGIINCAITSKAIVCDWTPIFFANSTWWFQGFAYPVTKHAQGYTAAIIGREWCCQPGMAIVCIHPWAVQFVIFSAPGQLFGTRRHVHIFCTAMSNVGGIPISGILFSLTCVNIIMCLLLKASRLLVFCNSV